MSLFGFLKIDLRDPYTKRVCGCVVACDQDQEESPRTATIYTCQTHSDAPTLLEFLRDLVKHARAHLDGCHDPSARVAFQLRAAIRAAEVSLSIIDRSTGARPGTPDPRTGALDSPREAPSLQSRPADPPSRREAAGEPPGGPTCPHGYIGACATCDGSGQMPEELL